MMQTCEKPVKHRPKLKELPEWFRKSGGNLREMGRQLGGYSPKQIRRWMAEHGPVIEADLNTALEAARAEHKRGKSVRASLPVSVPLPELRSLFATYYHTPWDDLIAAERHGHPDRTSPDAAYKFNLTGGSKSKSLLGRPLPNTGETLHQLLCWSDIKDIADALNEADEHVLMEWVKAGAKSRLSHRLAQLEPPEAPATVTSRQREAVLRSIYQAVAPKLIKRPERLKQKEVAHAR